MQPNCAGLDIVKFIQETMPEIRITVEIYAVDFAAIIHPQKISGHLNDFRRRRNTISQGIHLCDSLSPKQFS